MIWSIIPIWEGVIHLLDLHKNSLNHTQPYSIIAYYSAPTRQYVIEVHFDLPDGIGGGIAVGIWPGIPGYIEEPSGVGMGIAGPGGYCGGQNAWTVQSLKGLNKWFYAQKQTSTT